MNNADGASSKETVTFFYFFQWEYLRRNKKYIEDFDSFAKLVKGKFKKAGIDPGNIVFEIQKEAIINQKEAKRNWKKGRTMYAFDPPVDGQKMELYIDEQIKDGLVNFSNKYGMLPRFFQEGMTSDEMIDRLIAGEQVVTYEEFFLNDSAAYHKLISDAGVTVIRAPSTLGSKVVIEVDLDKPKELVSAATEYCHDTYNQLLKWHRSSDELKLNKELLENITDHVSVFLIKIINFHGWRNFKVLDQSRLIGLWMFDCLTKQNLMDHKQKARKATKSLMEYELKKRGYSEKKIEKIIDEMTTEKKNASRNMLKKNSISQIKPYLISPFDSGSKSIRRWLSNAEECVNAGKIIAISKN